MLKGAEHGVAMKRLPDSSFNSGAACDVSEVSDEDFAEAVSELLTGSLKFVLLVLGALIAGLTPAMFIIQSRSSAETDRVGIAYSQEHHGLQGVALAIDNVTLLGVRYADPPSGQATSAPSPTVFDHEVRRSLDDAARYVSGIFSCDDITFTDPNFSWPMRGGSAGAAFIVERAAQILGPPPMTVAATGALLEDGLIGSVGAVEEKVEAARATHEAPMNNVTLVLVPIGQGPTDSQMDGFVESVDVMKVLEVDSAEAVITAVWGQRAALWAECPHRSM